MPTLNEIKKRYHPDIVNHMLDVLYDTPIDELIDDVLHYTPIESLDAWAKNIQADNSYSDEVNQGV
jgi:hypothetical protein